MSYSVIRPQIKTLLDGVSSILEVSGTPTLQFNSYPSAYVVPSDNESDYETTSENVRVYAYTVRAFVETKHQSIANAFTQLEGVADDILDALDKEDLKGSDTRTVGISLPTGYTYLNIFATPSQWGQIEEDNLLTVEINVRVRISRDIT